MMSEISANTISFAGHAASSNQFKALYGEGMALVEETASYLDGPGRIASKALPRMASVLYAAESMRLTTRLMQVASWLLLQRAINNGEMTRDQVVSEKKKVRLDTFNVEVGAGLGPLAGKIWRVGLMGHSSSPRLIVLLAGALETAFAQQGRHAHA